MTSCRISFINSRKPGASMSSLFLNAGRAVVFFFLGQGRHRGVQRATEIIVQIPLWSGRAGCRNRGAARKRRASYECQAVSWHVKPFAGTLPLCKGPKMLGHRCSLRAFLSRAGSTKHLRLSSSAHSGGGHHSLNKSIPGVPEAQLPAVSGSL